jgi:hypothetical protein
MTSDRPAKKPRAGKAGRSELKRPVSKSEHGRQKPMNPFSVDLKEKGVAGRYPICAC